LATLGDKAQIGVILSVVMTPKVAKSSKSGAVAVQNDIFLKKTLVFVNEPLKKILCQFQTPGAYTMKLFTVVIYGFS
jgi:hypothetical protein